MVLAVADLLSLEVDLLVVDTTSTASNATRNKCLASDSQRGLLYGHS